MNIKKPPDKITTTKTSLKKILKKNVNYKSLHDFVLRTHKLIILVNQFIKAFILFKFKNSQDIPVINDVFVSMAFCTIYNTGAGRKPEGSKATLLAEMSKFYDDEFKA
jgi:hypothetical protein